jgi:flagellar protein FlbD
VAGPTIKTLKCHLYIYKFFLALSIMIALTKINGSKFVLNCEVIRYIETTPDTMISLLNGDKIIVKESPDEVVALAIEFSRRVRIFNPDLA